MELKDRLKQARKQAGLTQNQVAEAASMTQATYSQLERGIVKSTGKVVEIAKKLKVDPNWLATGQGSMTAPALQSNISPYFEPVSDWDDDTALEADEIAVPYYKDFGAACGYGSDKVAYDSEWRRLRISRATLDRIGSHRDQVFATRADGDSMSPTINDGDTIWVDRSKTTVKDDRIFVFEYGGLFLCKRLFRLPNNGLRVVSDNSALYPEYEITGAEREQNGFNLIGWVWHWSVIQRW